MAFHWSIEPPPVQSTPGVVTCPSVESIVFEYSARFSGLLGSCSFRRAYSVMDCSRLVLQGSAAIRNFNTVFRCVERGSVRQRKRGESLSGSHFGRVNWEALETLPFGLTIHSSSDNSRTVRKKKFTRLSLTGAMYHRWYLGTKLLPFRH